MRIHWIAAYLIQSATSSDEIAPGTLPQHWSSIIKIQKPVQPNIIETVSRLLPYHRLRVVRDRYARLRHHRKVVGAVADGNNLIAREPQSVAQFAQFRGL